MKRLIVCSDGTWQRPDQVFRGRPDATNVVKISDLIAPQDAAGVPQIVFYDQGVGTGDVLDRLLGGLTGYGLDQNILEAYGFIQRNYAVGDELFLFGFSRGAYTVRSLAGMIRKCGIVGDPADAKRAMDLYRDAQHPDDPGPTQFRDAHALHGAGPVPIKFIGVWDTVGALGIPLRPLSKLTFGKYQFHNTHLSGSVQFAYQALAVDERRGPFLPTLWSGPAKPGQTLEQVWFSGQHSDVGGGAGSEGLPAITLEWMIGKARGAGLAFDPILLARHPLAPDPLAAFNWIEGAPFWHLVQVDREVGVDDKGSPDPTQSLNPTILTRWDDTPSYRPPGLRRDFARRGDRRAADPQPPALGLFARLRASFGL